MNDDERAWRDSLGALVREAWVRWAETQPDPKSSWLVPYAQLGESDKEADRQIGEHVVRCLLDSDPEALPAIQRARAALCRPHALLAYGDTFAEIAGRLNVPIAGLAPEEAGPRLVEAVERLQGRLGRESMVERSRRINEREALEPHQLDDEPYSL